MFLCIRSGSDTMGGVVTEEDLLQPWGKLGVGESFHPAVFHMLDVGNVAAALLTREASPRWLTVLQRAFGAGDAEQIRVCVPLLVAMHDLGKISAGFQGQKRPPQREAHRERLVRAGYLFPSGTETDTPHHSTIGAIFARDEWTHAEAAPPPEVLIKVVADALAGHHGAFPALTAFSRARDPHLRLEEHEPRWCQARAAAYRTLRQMVGAALDGPVGGEARWLVPSHRSAAVMALVGFTILCDWLGSDARERYFPPVLPAEMTLDDYARRSRERARRAVADRGWLSRRTVPAYPGFTALFPEQRSARPLQQAIDALPSETIAAASFFVIEAPTGEGKTEAALALARRLAAVMGTDELYVALPTMATSNAMHRRIQAFVERVAGIGLTVRLIHGQAHLLDDDETLSPASSTDADAEGSENARAAQEWFAPKKRALLAPFGTGTVDQLELAALHARFYMLRLAGLAGKVIIVDEVHAYDTYMSSVLEQALRWLGLLGSSVILLSATLPSSRRQALQRAFAEGAEAKLAGAVEPPVAQAAPRPRTLPPPRRAAPAEPAVVADVSRTLDSYPLITAWAAGQAHCSTPTAWQPERRIHVDWLPAVTPEDDAAYLYEQVRHGAVVCRLCNTVDEAQRVFEALRHLAGTDRTLPPVKRYLLHARLPLEQRFRRERVIAGRCGPDAVRRPERAIIVGTQVLEQSLDLDFDALITDFAPLDLLLQRIGRLHRHFRCRRPTCQRPMRHRTPVVSIRLGREDEDVPKFGSSTAIYSGFILWKSLVALKALLGKTEDEIRLPEQYRPLVEETYDDVIPEGHRWTELMRDAWTEHQKEEVAQQEGAKQRVIPSPDPRESPALEPRPAFDENAGPEQWLSAKTRWGDEGVMVVPLHLVNGDLCLFPDGRQPLPRATGAPSRGLQLRVLRRGFPLSYPRSVVRELRPDALKRVSDAQRRAVTWFKRGALFGDAVPLVFEGGTARVGGRVLVLDARFGLQLRQ